MIEQSRAFSRPLVSCLLNVSEGRNQEILRKILRSTIESIKSYSELKLNGRIGAIILNVFSDYEYNRTVITIAGENGPVQDAVVTAASQAMELIDLERHVGGHPRLGSVDLIPIHPLCEKTTLEDCGKIATSIAHDIRKKVPSSSFFFFGHSDPNMKGLIERRKQMGWFSSQPSIALDLGTSQRKYGITGVGSSFYMTNFNISIATTDQTIGRNVLRAIRQRSGGFRGVSGMAFPHEGGLEIACNIDMFPYSNQNQPSLSSLINENNRSPEVLKDVHDYEELMPGLWRVRFASVENTVARVCLENGVNILPTSRIIGFSPEIARQMAISSLTAGHVFTDLAANHM